MKLSLGVGISSFKASGSASGPTITGAGSVSPGSYASGVEETITAGTASATGGGTVSYEYRWLLGGVSDASTAAYTPQVADEGTALAAQWRAVETGGTNAGATAWQTVGSGTIVSPNVAITTGAPAADTPTAHAPTVTATDASSETPVTWDSFFTDVGATTELAFTDSDQTVSATANISGQRHATGVDALIGKVYWEVLATSDIFGVGVVDGNMTISSGGTNGVNRAFKAGSLIYYSDGLGGGTNTSIGDAHSDGDRLCVAVDTTAELLWIRRNDGAWNGSLAGDPAAGTGGVSIEDITGSIYAYAIISNATTAEATLHGSDVEYLYAKPTGFTDIENMSQENVFLTTGAPRAFGASVSDKLFTVSTDDAPTAIGFSWNSGTDTLTLSGADTDVDHVHWMFNGSPATAADVVNGTGGDLSGDFAIASGSGSDSIDVTSLAYSTTHSLHVVLEDAAGQYSAISTQTDIEGGGSDLQITTGAPAADAPTANPFTATTAVEVTTGTPAVDTPTPHAPTVSTSGTSNSPFVFSSPDGIVFDEGTPSAFQSVTVTAGTKLIAIIAGRSGKSEATHSISDDDGGTWTQIDGYDNVITDGNGRCSCSVWIRDVPVAGTTSFDITAEVDGTNKTWVAYRSIDCDKAYVYTVRGSAMNGSGTAHASSLSSGVVSAQLGDLVYGFGMTRNGTAPTTHTLTDGGTSFDITGTDYGATNGVSIVDGLFNGDELSTNNAETIFTQGGSTSEGISGLVVFQED